MPKKYMNILFLAATILCTLVGAVWAQNGPTPGGGSQEINIALPQRWTEQFPPEHGAARYFAYSNPQGILVAKVYLYETREIDAALSLELYQEAFEQNLRAAFRTYDTRSKWDSSVGGVPAKFFDFSFSTRELPNMTMKGRTASFIKGSDAFSMVLITLDTFFDEFTPHFGGMVTSVQFLPSSSAGAVAVTQPPQAMQQALSTAPGTLEQGTGTVPQRTETSGNLPLLVDDTAGGLPLLTDDASFNLDYPGGHFSIRMPEIPLERRVIPDGVEFILSGDLTVTILGFPVANWEELIQQRTIAYEKDKRKRGESTVAGGNRNAKVMLYTFSASGKNLATLTAVFPDAPILILMTIPAEAYNSRQQTLNEIFHGAIFK